MKTLIMFCLLAPVVAGIAHPSVTIIMDSKGNVVQQPTRSVLRK